MKLIKDKQTVTLTDEFVISIYKESGWEEVKEETKKEFPKKETKKIEPAKPTKEEIEEN